MLTKPESCLGCPLYNISEGFSRPTGTGALGVLVVAEALGRTEAKEGRPLVEYADSGSLLQRAFDKAGYSREQFALWNVCACRPPDNKLEGMPWEYGAARHCNIAHFKGVLSTFRPRVILALGNVALKHLTGYTGYNRTISSLRGYVLKDIEHPGVKVVATYHPSYLRRGALNLFRVFVQDLILAVNVAQGEAVEHRDYVLDPTPPPGFVLSPSEGDIRDLLERLRSDPKLLLAYDIETDRSIAVDEAEIFKLDDEKGDSDNEKQEEEEFDASKALAGPIIQIQFSTEVGHAVSVPFTRAYLPAVRDILGTDNPKIGHNAWRFDDPLLRLSGMRVNGQRSDTLWAWHHSQPDLPAHLQFVASQFGQPYPWKHLAGSDLAFYGAVDVEVLHRIWNTLPDAMRAKAVEGWDPRCEIRTVWEGYKHHVEDLNVVLERMSERGIPVNKTKLEAFGVEIDALKDATFTKLDAAFLPEYRKVASFYKREPSDVTGLVLRPITYTTPQLTTAWVPCKCKRPERCKKCRGTKFVEKKVRGDKVEVTRELWCKLRPFAPSYDQIGAYIKAKGHKPPTRATRKGEGTNAREKATTDKTALEQLYRQTGDDFYISVVKYRNYDKLKGTYVKGWAPRPDGRVHPSFLFRPATGQLSSVGPNCQNAIGEKAGELGLRFRACIEARPGHKIVAFDWTGLHAYMLGFLAGCPDYMRLSRLGIHDFVAAHILRKELPGHIADLEKLTGGKRYAKEQALRKAGLGVTVGDLSGLLERVDACSDWLHLSDDDLSERLRLVKKLAPVYRSKVKPAVHGYGFGIGAFKLWKTYPESFSSTKEAQEIVDMLNSLFPRVAAYREYIKDLADRQGYLISPYGSIRYFHNVYDKRPVAPNHEPRYGERMFKGRNGLWYKSTPGMDAEKAIAFLPANCSFSVKKDVMLELARQGLDERYGLFNDIHDELDFECRDELVEECRENVLTLMQAPSKFLVGDLAPEGLRCYGTCSVGQDWSCMKEA